MEQYRVALVTKSGKTKSKNFNTKSKAEDYILNIATKEGIKRAVLLNRDTKEREVTEGLE